MPATIAAPSDTSSVENSEDAALLDRIKLIFRFHQYPHAISIEVVKFLFERCAPGKPLASNNASGVLLNAVEHLDAFVTAVEGGIHGVSFHHDGGLEGFTGLPCMALDDPLPPSQLHRLVLAILCLPSRYVCRAEDMDTLCIQSNDVNFMLNAVYGPQGDLDDFNPTPVSAWDELDTHPLLEVFYIDETKYYSLSVCDPRVVTQYLDEADAAVGALIGGLGFPEMTLEEEIDDAMLTALWEGGDHEMGEGDSDDNESDDSEGDDGESGNGESDDWEGDDDSGTDTAMDE